jgi:hypothetical protein
MRSSVSLLSRLAWICAGEKASERGSGGSGGTRKDSPAGNGSKIQLGSNHIDFELVLAMIAVDH